MQILINCGRGPSVDFRALHDALTTGRIAGARLDVFPQEPPSASKPVLSLDNVVLSPHLAGASRETRIRQTHNGFDNVLRVARGRRPLWLLPELGDMETWSYSALRSLIPVSYTHLTLPTILRV